MQSFMFRVYEIVSNEKIRITYKRILVIENFIFMEKISIIFLKFRIVV